MNVFYSFDRETDLITIHYAGEPSLEEWTEVMLAALNDPRFHPGVKLLLDRSRVGPPSAEFVEGVSNFVSSHREVLSRCPCAIVVGGQAAYGMARMGQALLDIHGVAFRIFDDVETAKEWLLTVA
jgi:hypothetical protein